MNPLESPAGEASRLRRLHTLRLLGTAPEELLDGFTRLAARITGKPVALLSLIDAEEQWVKSRFGLPVGVQLPQHLPRESSLCAHAIRSPPGVFEVEDARADPRFAHSPVVVEEPRVVHYAGVALVMPGGEAIGTLSVAGPESGRLEPVHRDVLEELAREVVRVLLLREQEQMLLQGRQLAEAALQQKNRLLESILENLPCGFQLLDDEQRIVLSNERARRLLADDNVVLETDPAETAAVKRHLLAEGDGHPCMPGPLASAPAGYRLVEVRSAALQDGGAVATFTDVTAARRASLDLASSQERLGRALDASGLGLWEFDLRTGNVFLAAGCAHLMGYPPEDIEVAPEDVLGVLSRRGAGSVAATRRRLLRGQIERFSVEHEVLCGADRTAGWLRVAGQVSERCADGTPLKFVGTCKDVTERRIAEAELRAAMEAADQVNRAKTDFLATMSHEIRTPLNGMFGLARLLSGADLPPVERESVVMLTGCAKKLLSVVDNILDFSKIEAGHLALQEVPTDLAGLARQLAGVFGVAAREKGIEFGFELDERVPCWVSADPTRLRQILLNLLGNAFKFTASGRVSFSIRLAPSGAGDMLEFSVADTGIGIPLDAQQRLFTRFTQVDASTTRRYGGTGLGLAISRQLAALMGGDIALASAPGVGSDFTLRLPLRRAAAPAQRRPATPSRVVGEARILVAEDNAVNQHVARRTLQALGYRSVTMVGDGNAVLRACRVESFDVILMDCQMPELDGRSATAALRREGVRTPVIALTATATATDRDECLRSGMDDYMSKPIELSVLGQKLELWLEHGQAEAGSPASAPVPAPDAAASFDPSALARYFRGDCTFFMQARDIFVQTTREALRDMGRALEAGDEKSLHLLAHRIRGSAAMLGAELLARLCRQVETEPASNRQQRHWLDEAGDAFDAFIAQSAIALQDDPALTHPVGMA